MSWLPGSAAVSCSHCWRTSTRQTGSPAASRSASCCTLICRTISLPPVMSKGRLQDLVTRPLHAQAQVGRLRHVVVALDVQAQPDDGGILPGGAGHVLVQGA